MKFDTLINNRVFVATVGIIVLLMAYYFMYYRPKQNAKKASGYDSANDSEEYTDNNDCSKKATFAEADYTALADSIYSSLRYSALDDNKREAKRILLMMNNSCDIHYLSQKFGIRREYFFGIPNGPAKPLHPFITSNLSKSAIEEINDDYQKKGITFRF